MTPPGLGLLAFALAFPFSSAPGPLPYAGKSIQSLSKDVFGSVGSMQSQSKFPQRGPSMEEQTLPPEDMGKGKAEESYPLARDKRKKVKYSVENHTGLRKQPIQDGKGFPSEGHQQSILPTINFSQTNRMHTDRLQRKAANSISAFFRPPVYSHRQGRLLAEAYPFKNTGTSLRSLDHFHQPGKISPYGKPSHSLSNATDPSWLTNRRVSSLPYHRSVSKNDADNTEVCMADCRGEHEEVEAFCSSEFVVNGIVHDVIMIHKGTSLVTLLVSNNGLYKTNRLYFTPDGFFLRIHMMVVDTLNCSKPCPDFKLGSRYIMMGQLYHRRRQLPAILQEHVRGHLRPGDGLLWRGNSYMKRFNRRRHQKVQQAAHTKCG